MLEPLLARSRRAAAAERQAVSDRRALLGSLVLFGLGWLAAWLGGFRMVVPEWYFQLLPAELLRDRLFESLYNLHAQPPLLDLLFGLALKVEREVGVPASASLLAVQTLVGGLAVLALTGLSSSLGMRGWRRATVVGLLVANPAFYHFVFLFFQPVHELCFLSLAALGLRRFLESATAARAAGFCAPLLALGYARSLFHFSWILGVVLVAMIFAERASPPTANDRRGRWLVAAATALLLLAWPAKNALRFGVFSFSSWQGYNLSRDLGLPDPAALAAFSDRAGAPGVAAESQAQALVPQRFVEIPALARLYKANGSPNWNHYAIIPLARDLGTDALRFLRRHPRALFERAWQNYARRFTLYPGRQPYSRTLVGEARSPFAARWMTAYEALVLERPDLPLNGFALLFPPALAYSGWRSWRRWHDGPAASAVVVFVVSAALWVVAMALCVDGRESNRMRFSTEPLVWLSLAWAAGSAKPQRDHS